MKDVDLSIVLSKYNRADAEKLFPKQIKVVSNGIPDPCPAYEQEILPRRAARFAARKKLAAGQPLSEEDLESSGGNLWIFKVRYISPTAQARQGLFDASTHGAFRR